VSDPWMEYSLPLGNGQLGASLFGGVRRDQVLFNEKTLWTGGIGISDYRADYGDGVIYGCYQVFGSLYAECLDDFGDTAASPIQGYVRTLDLDEGVGTVRYTSPDGAVNYLREYFVSYPDNAIIIRYSADKKKRINLRFSMESGKPGVVATTSYANGCGRFNGKLNTISYAAEFRVVPKGGTLQTEAEGITVKGADEVVVVLAAQTDYDAYSPTYVSHTSELVNRTSATVQKAASKRFKGMKADHIKDFKQFMGRVVFDLGGTNTLPTDKLVDAYSNTSDASPEARMLEELYYHYGRYLEISSSRGVDLPSNLQGIWNHSSSAPWHCDIHANINVQMNYWPAETGNLSEMHERFTNYIWNEAINHPEWRQNARQYAHQTKGWTMFTENNIFGGGSVFQTNYVIGNAWHCTHLWQHYRYTLDRDFLLRKALPTMWSCCEFWLERLTLADDGTYECPNEFSPEQGPRGQNATAHAQQLVAELFANTLAAINEAGEEACGISASDIADLQDKYKRLDKGLATETYDGRWGTKAIAEGSTLLREWKYSTFDAGENGHRHMSHLMCLYPFHQVTPRSGTLFEAAVNSMKLRGDYSTGWSMGWKINLWARALNGNRAHEVLRTALQHSKSYGMDYNKGGIYYNLYCSHAPYQIDGNLGACAGIMEMVLQSQTDTLQLLPALPDAWQRGVVKGLKAVGGYTIDMEWQEG
ncbi:MAG: glycoside hydrolase family 95 protein, partial [Bacteroidaceae bacterium]|nr:glycoside hydrolase family 95 protein [Bacteroidaceae bacterium]